LLCVFVVNQGKLTVEPKFCVISYHVFIQFYANKLAANTVTDSPDADDIRRATRGEIFTDLECTLTADVAHLTNTVTQ